MQNWERILPGARKLVYSEDEARKLSRVMVASHPRQRIIPPLENGDSLTRSEFERRYNAMPYLKKAELIEGIVYMPAALRFTPHAEPHAQMMTCLGVYQAFTLGVRLGDNPTVRLDELNELQPDAVLFIEKKAGGRVQISEDLYLEGAPELIVEIAASSAAIDLHQKKQVYLRHGVKEYIVWQVLDEQLDWFYLEGGEYLNLAADAEGRICSRTFPGLWLAVEDLLAGEMQEVLAALQAGLDSPEHEAFKAKLSSFEEESF